MKPQPSGSTPNVRPTAPVSLSEAIRAVLDSGLPDRPRVMRQAIDIVLGSGSEAAGHLTPRRAAAQVSALAWSLLHSGRAGAAIRLADRRALSLLSLAAGEAPASTQSACYSALAEVFLLNGRLSSAATCAASAADYATGQEAHRFRALSLQAASQALNGEFNAAARAMGSAREVDAGRGWSSSSWPLALAGLQIGFRRGDSEGMEQILDALVGGDDAVARSAAPARQDLAQCGPRGIPPGDSRRREPDPRGRPWLPPRRSSPISGYRWRRWRWCTSVIPARL
ncbi:MAG: hypothetical protein KIT69_00405 [Propionibacteriaceae bacterium]|nr:hypothetical protein [Propionibacteriaceae bacterium]